MSERAISDPSQHGWVEVDGKWMWDSSGGSGGGGSIQDGDTEGQITTWDGTEWTPSDDMVVNGGIMKLFDRGSGDGEVRLFHEDDATSLIARGSAGSSGTFSISTSDGGTSVERLTIDPDGNVGIGTDTPLYTRAGRTALTVNGDTSANLVFGHSEAPAHYLLSDASGLTIGDDSGANLIIDGDGTVNINSSTNTAKINITNDSGTYEIANNEFGSLAINYNGAEKLVLASNGDVYLKGKLFINGDEVTAGGGGLWTDNGDGTITFSGTAKATDFVTT